MSKSEIICKHCGLVNDYTERPVGPHLSAYCNGCDRFVKHLPQNIPMMIYFGKYKGRYVSSMHDKDEIQYLEWTLTLSNITEKLRICINKHLNNFD